MKSLYVTHELLPASLVYKVLLALSQTVYLQFEHSTCAVCACHPRYAGCSYETAAAAESGDGSLLVKGIKAVWRQSAPLLQNTLMVRGYKHDIVAAVRAGGDLYLTVQGQHRMLLLHGIPPVCVGLII